MKLFETSCSTRTLKSLSIIILLIITSACSDSDYSVGDDDPGVVIVIPPPPAEAIEVIINGAVINQVTSDIIPNASVAFYENNMPATNVLNADGQSIDSLVTTDGSFQVTTEEGISSFSVIASADGFLDKILQVEFTDDDELVPLQISMLPETLDSVVVVQEEVAIGGSEVLEEISVSTENETASTEGSAEVLLPASVVLQDENGVAVNMSSLSVEINYIESQGYDEPETAVTVITEPNEVAQTQQVYVSDSELGDDQTVSVTFSYKSDSAVTSGVGFSVNFDSDVIDVASISNVFEGATESGSQQADTDNSDNDDSTDQLLNFSWSSATSNQDEPAESVTSTPTLVSATQHVYVSSSTKSSDGSQAIVTLSYMADDSTTTGVGFKVDFDPTVLSLAGVSDVFSGAIASGALDEDGDSLAFGWASLFGSFPGSPTVELATITFDIADGATDSTSLSFEKTSTAAGFDFAGQSHDIVLTNMPEPTFPGSTSVQLATVTFSISEGAYGYANINIIETSSDEAYTFVGQSQEIAIGDAPIVDEEPLSIASLIPEGLNADQTTDEVLVPVGVAEINMTTDDGTPIKSFSQPITITINLPEDTEVPSQGRNVQAGDQFTVRSFDSDTLVWTTEENPAVVGNLSDGLYPANLEIDHLTIFALADPVAACNSAIEFVMTGDTVPESGLQMFISANDIEETVSIKSASAIISADEAKASGFVADVNKLYQVKVTDYTGNTWYESDDGLSLCGNTNAIALNNPIQVVNETLSVNLVCNNDALITAPLENGIVIYRKDLSSATLVASESSDGVYSLEQLDSSQSAYQVTIDTRIDAGIVTTSVTPDGNDESYTIEVECDIATGTGTGTGSS